MLREYVGRTLALVGFVLVLTFLVGATIGQPVLLSFVTSGSMSPTIQEGEGFVAIPDQVAGDIEEGDVIVFEAEEIQGGGLTTHRVVEVTEQGYITQGDANPFTDQDGDEPPVRQEQVVAVAYQPGGEVVTIPAIGTIVLGGRAVVTNLLTAVTTLLGVDTIDESRQAGTVLLVAGVSLFVLSLLTGIRSGAARERSRSHEQDTVDPRYVTLFFLAIVLVPANAAMVLPNTTHQVPVGEIAAAGDTDPGDPITVDMSATNEDSLITVLVVFDSPEQGAISDRTLDIPGGKTDSTVLTATAPPRDEQRVVTVSERRYLVVLPPSMLESLHNIHPLAALATINAALTFGVSTVTIGLLGARKRRQRSTSRDIPLAVQLKRLFR